MSHEPASSSERNFGAFRSCLVEGDPEQRARERRVRRKAMAISTLLQAAALAAVVLVPLLFVSDRIALANNPPLPIFSHGGGPRHAQSARQHRSIFDHPQNCFLCPPTSIPPHIPSSAVSTGVDSALSELPPGVGSGFSDIIGAIPSRDDGARRPHPPQPPTTTVQSPRVVQITHLDPAMLVHRVEPIYPFLPKQLHRSGRVELHAVIATDGSIQSLQAVAGDPLFFQSAMDAVRQWRYRATVLNGRLVEVDTYITVIYQLQ